MDSSDKDKGIKTSHLSIEEKEYSKSAVISLDTVMKIATTAVALNESDDKVDNARAEEMLNDAIELLGTVKKR